MILDGAGFEHPAPFFLETEESIFNGHEADSHGGQLDIMWSR